jgi:hypothetical protein
VRALPQMSSLVVSRVSEVLGDGGAVLCESLNNVAPVPLMKAMHAPSEMLLRVRALFIVHIACA